MSTGKITRFTLRLSEFSRFPAFEYYSVYVVVATTRIQFQHTYARTHAQSAKQWHQRAYQNVVIDFHWNGARRGNERAFQSTYMPWPNTYDAIAHRSTVHQTLWVGRRGQRFRPHIICLRLFWWFFIRHRLWCGPNVYKKHLSSRIDIIWMAAAQQHTHTHHTLILWMREIHHPV